MQILTYVVVILVIFLELAVSGLILYIAFTYFKAARASEKRYRDLCRKPDSDA
jgi:hypothetical protein